MRNLSVKASLLVFAIGLCGVQGSGIAEASVLPPHHVTVVTQCHVPVMVDVTDNRGAHRYYGADASKMANLLPFNLWQEAGCTK